MIYYSPYQGILSKQTPAKSGILYWLRRDGGVSDYVVRTTKNYHFLTSPHREKVGRMERGSDDKWARINR